MRPLAIPLVIAISTTLGARSADLGIDSGVHGQLVSLDDAHEVVV